MGPPDAAGAATLNVTTLGPQLDPLTKQPADVAFVRKHSARPGVAGGLAMAAAQRGGTLGARP
eukprot:11154625-Lingulodinium_polyedra.AAC.1